MSYDPADPRYKVILTCTITFPIRAVDCQDVIDARDILTNSIPTKLEAWRYFWGSKETLEWELVSGELHPDAKSTITGIQLQELPNQEEPEKEEPECN